MSVLDAIIYLKKDNNEHEAEPWEKESTNEGKDGHHEDGRGGRQDDEVDDHKDANRLEIFTSN